MLPEFYSSGKIHLGCPCRYEVGSSCYVCVTGERSQNVDRVACLLKTGVKSTLMPSLTLEVICLPVDGQFPLFREQSFLYA